MFTELKNIDPFTLEHNINMSQMSCQILTITHTGAIPEPRSTAVFYDDI